MFSGVTSTTPQKLQLDAGAFLKNYDVTNDTWATAKTTKLLGATAGGGSFGAVPTIRRIEVDGVKGATKGFEALDEWVVTMTANMKELDADVLKLALATGSSSDVTLYNISISISSRNSKSGQKPDKNAQLLDGL